MVMCAVKPDLWAGVVKFELLLLVVGGTIPIGAAWSVQSVPFVLPLLCAVPQIAFEGDSAVFDAGPGAALHVGGARTVWHFDSASTPSSVPPSSALPVGSSLGQCCTAIQWSAPLASSVLAAISSWDDQPVAARLLQTSSAQAHLECVDVRADHQWIAGQRTSCGRLLLPEACALPYAPTTPVSLEL